MSLIVECLWVGDSQAGRSAANETITRYRCQVARSQPPPLLSSPRRGDQAEGLGAAALSTLLRY